MLSTFSYFLSQPATYLHARSGWYILKYVVDPGRKPRCKLYYSWPANSIMLWLKFKKYCHWYIVSQWHNANTYLTSLYIYIFSSERERQTEVCVWWRWVVANNNNHNKSALYPQPTSSHLYPSAPQIITFPLQFSQYKWPHVSQRFLISTANLFPSLVTTHFKHFNILSIFCFHDPSNS